MYGFAGFAVALIGAVALVRGVTLLMACVTTPVIVGPIPVVVLFVVVLFVTVPFVVVTTVLITVAADLDRDTACAG